MNSTIPVGLWRLLLGAAVVVAVFAGVVGGLGLVVTSPALRLLLPFVAAAVSSAGLAGRLTTTQARPPSPDTGLADVTAAIQAGSRELEARVGRADELASQLQASRQRLTRARELERQRLVGELTQVTTARLATLRGELAEIQRLLSSGTAEPERAQQALAHARSGLDELLDRFRVIARGMYPAVLRGQGPAGALEELAADLPRPVCLSGRPSQRLSWEVESGIYWLAASAMQQLASRPAQQPLRVHLEHTGVDCRPASRIRLSGYRPPGCSRPGCRADRDDRSGPRSGYGPAAPAAAGGDGRRAAADGAEPARRRAAPSGIAADNPAYADSLTQRRR